MVVPAVPSLTTIEIWLRTQVPLTTPAPPSSHGRPPILPGAMLWAGLLLCVLRGWTSQRELWRLLSVHGVWDFPAQPISDDAVYRRLERDGDAPMRALLETVTTTLLDAAVPDTTLAPFATEVVAIDETTLDPVARRWPRLRAVPTGDDRLLPGKLAAVFDVRRQLYRQVQHTPYPRQNERVLARTLVEPLPAGSLILADLGYFGFQWFDDLTDAGYWWLSRERTGTSTVPAHVLYADGAVRDELVWLGAYRADQAGHLVRRLQIPHGEQVHGYLTNVLDPAVLPLAAVGPLYGRRWDIEMAVNLIKTELGLHLLWSAKPVVILTQIWATLVIAQVALALRGRIARQARVDAFDVSLPLLLRELPRLAAHGTRDPVAWFVAVGRAAGFIRPSRRIRWVVPDIPPEAIIPPPEDLVTVRKRRYAGRRCRSDGTDRRPT